MIDSFAPVNPNLIDVPLPEDGYPDDKAAGDTIDVLRDMCGAASREFPASWWVEPRDWEEVARENDKHQTWGMNYVDRFTHQGNSHECTCHSLRANFECAWNAQRGVILGPPKNGVRLPTSAKGSPVWVSPLSVYAEANPGQWGGASVREVLEIAVRRGMLPEPKQPKPYRFKHTLQGTIGADSVNQSGGAWVPMSRFPSGWQETAKHFRPLEVVFAESFEQAICILLRGRMNSVGRDGHAVPWGAINFVSQAIAYPDSYNVIRYDSFSKAKSAWRGSFSIISTTAPDDWDNPAGAAA